MAFLRQTWTLTEKNLLVVLQRHWFFTTIRAFLAPIIFMFFISYAKNFFVPPSEFGIGSPAAIRSFTEALHAAQGQRNTVVFVNNGHTGGAIESVIDKLSATVKDAGKTAHVVQSDTDLLTACASSLRGVSTCFGAVSFHSSPNEGSDGAWNYTLRADGTFGERIYVNKHDNDVEVYVLPLQHAVDTTIASLNGTSAQPTIQEYPFTDETAEERDTRIRHLYMGALINILAVAFYVGICGVTYQLTGHMASERELGLSQLIEAMTPAKRNWHNQAARLLSTHIAFDIIYLPGWIIMAAIITRLAFPTSSYAILIIYHILAGLALSSFSIFGASFFHKAQLSGISVTIAAIVLAIIAQVAGPFGTGATAVLSLLFPSMNYVFFVIYVARFEKISQATNLVKSPPSGPSSLPGIAFWILLIVQTVVYPILGALIERWLYGTASKERKMVSDSPLRAITLENFSKHYLPSWFRRKVLARFGVKPREPVIAVNNFSLAAPTGEIMVLLGANGSGKSTTLDAIAGLGSITKGAIYVDGTGGLGLCPQKNVMWDELTVFEHVRIFNRLKSLEKNDSKTEIENLVKACDLGHKLKAQSKTLSGGQKRKLQLAMMFTGGSRVCCVDEVSSGLDPLSRRKIWDILLAERGRRTFLLTTHFLDEADVLADQVVVLSKGNLKAEGSSAELKQHYGGGYRITVPRGSEHPNYGHKAVSTTADGGTIYELQDSAEAAQFVKGMERKNVHVAGPTLESVFLNLAEEVKGDNLEAESPTVDVKHTPNRKDLDGAPASDQSSEDEAGPKMSKGNGTTMSQQTWILILKRFTILRRNYLPYVCALLLPIITAGLVTLFLKDFHAVGCDPGAQASNPTVYSINRVSITPLIPIGPQSLVDIPGLARLTGLDPSSFHAVNTIDEFNDFIMTRFHNVTPGGFFLGSEAGRTPLMSYVGNGDVLGGLVTLNVLDSVLAGTPIATSYQSFAVPFAPGAGKTLQLILYFGLAMSVYPAFFALYPTVERLRKVRALHYSNGIRAAPLWLAYVIFDFTFVLIVSAVVTGIFVGASDAWYAPGYLFVVFFLYGLTSILLCYVISLLVTSQLATFAFAAGGQACFFLIYFIMDMSILTYSPAYNINRDLTLSHFIYSTITPAGNLLRTLLLSLNEFSLLCHNKSLASYPGSITVYGGPILYLTLQAIFLFIFLVWWDSGWKPAFLTTTKHRSPDTESTDSIDPTVRSETERVESAADSLRVLHLSKTFGKNKAVQDITFGIPRGEVFALLGPNGAGKSSTISLIRGDIRPSHHGGDVLIEDISIMAHRAAARGHLGVCPQFDAMDTMTVREHLSFYARARGVHNLSTNISAVLSAVGLLPFADRMANALSGGNKRKLSLGIALMGNPSVLLLDEPSSGMDVAAKRVMWRTLVGVAAPGRGVLITTHSMEEADALATRVGIMKARMLALGTPSSLCALWGDAPVVHLVLNLPPNASEEEKQGFVGDVLGKIREEISEIEVEERGGVGCGQVRFRVLRGSGLGVAELVAVLEGRRGEWGVKFFSVSETTLDDVFLNIVGREEVEEGRDVGGEKVEGRWFGMRRRR